jgi:trehalose 6-phosphate synthase/phosphatase
VDDDELIALYRAADVMIVTPLRDGMNLVAKEFIAAREADDGVLVLSEFAGASAELDAAIMVNPYDINGVAAAIRRAVEMPDDERQLRMRRLRAQVRASPVGAWALRFLEDLRRTTVVGERLTSPPTALDAHVDAIGGARRRVLLLDYDGTLVPLAALPDLARPDRALLALLRSLAATPGIELHVVSGRSRDGLGGWLRDVPIWLHAEHGFWSRTPSGAWSSRGHDTTFREAALAIMERYAKITPGTLVEPKDASVAFHHRGADPRLASVRLLALRRELDAALGPQAELMDGHKVIEVRPAGVLKGCVGRDGRAGIQPPVAVLAAGDDRTDEDMFAALGTDALTIRVGPGATRARFRVGSPFELRRLLMRLASADPAGPAAAAGRETTAPAVAGTGTALPAPSSRPGVTSR